MKRNSRGITRFCVPLFPRLLYDGEKPSRNFLFLSFSLFLLLLLFWGVAEGKRELKASAGEISLYEPAGVGGR